MPQIYGRKSCKSLPVLEACVYQIKYKMTFKVKVNVMIHNWNTFGLFKSFCGQLTFTMLWATPVIKIYKTTFFYVGIF